MARSDELCAVAACSEAATCGVSRCGSAIGDMTLPAFGRFGGCAVFAGWSGLSPETCGMYVRLLLGCIVRVGFSGGRGGADCAFSGFCGAPQILQKWAPATSSFLHFRQRFITLLTTILV